VGFDGSEIKSPGAKINGNAEAPSHCNEGEVKAQGWMRGDRGRGSCVRHGVVSRGVHRRLAWESSAEAEFVKGGVGIRVRGGVLSESAGKACLSFKTGDNMKEDSGVGRIRDGSAWGVMTRLVG